MSISAPTTESVVAPASLVRAGARHDKYRDPMPRWTIGVDTGGTFTDCVARCDDGSVRRSKVPSSGELRARVAAAAKDTIALAGLPPVPDGFWVGFELLAADPVPIRVVASSGVDERTSTLTLASAPCRAVAVGSVASLRCSAAVPVLAARIALGRPFVEPLDGVNLRVGTTIGTNALLEGRTARVMLVTTAGHEDALLIGDQRRSDIFALAPSRRTPVASLCVGIRGRMSSAGTAVMPLEMSGIEAAAATARRERIDSVAIAFVHSGVNPSHERAAAKALRDACAHVVTSADTAVATSFLPRANAAVIEAALRPAIGRFIDDLRRDARGTSLFLSASSGSPVPATDYMAKDSLLSGPAAGVAAAARAALALGFERCVTLDVGGTSAD
ncbi:MAG: hypothetical protein FGM37_08360, partial [Phycisphaerales bacterium]|nr:hypothetical protein [Phycisphaerales bacterium]